MTQPRAHLADIVAELTRTHTHREHYTVRVGQTWFGQDHVTNVPSLIHQLAYADRPDTGDTGAGGYASRPAARVESLDTLMTIDREASRWVRTMGHDDPADRVIRDHDGNYRHDLGSGAAACILLLHGLLPSLEPCKHRGLTCCQHHELDRDLRRWWTMARIATGWDSPAWRPANTCPVCGLRGGLRVKLAAQSAFCVECRETWDESSIGLLAEHIRVENADVDGGDTPTGPEAA